MEIDQPIEEEFLYLQVTNHITRQIQQLTLKTGDKLPSLRALSKEKGISLTTAYKAYAQLEMNGLIEARPKSGYYVRYTPVRSLGATSMREMPVAPDMDDEDELINIYWRNFGREGMVKFSLAGPDISFCLRPS
jgi:DNA-binding transcriptional regulator YhcF (GntR family)